MAHNIPMDKIDHLMGNILVDNFISFSDDEIPLDGRESAEALHITIKCKDYILPRVVIDNGSSLNVMPMTTLSSLSIDAHMKHYMVVRAFDETRKEVTDKIELANQIGPYTFNIEF